MDTEGKSTIANKRTSEKKNVINSNGKHNGHPVETAAKNSRHRHEGARNRQRGKQTKNETTAVRLKKKQNNSNSTHSTASGRSAAVTEGKVVEI